VHHKHYIPWSGRWINDLAKPSQMQSLLFYQLCISVVNFLVCRQLFLDFSGEFCLPQFDPEFLVTPDFLIDNWSDFLDWLISKYQECKQDAYLLTCSSLRNIK